MRRGPSRSGFLWPLWMPSGAAPVAGQAGEAEGSVLSLTFGTNFTALSAEAPAALGSGRLPLARRLSRALAALRGGATLKSLAVLKSVRTRTEETRTRIRGGTADALSAVRRRALPAKDSIDVHGDVFY